MKLKRVLTAAVAALAMTAFMTGCQDKNNVSVDENSASNSAGSSQVIIPVKEDGVTDIIEPEEGAKEAELGSYRQSAAGVKLYYDDTQIPAGVMLLLERYFTAYANYDFEGYKACLFDKYADNMETALQRDYEYGLDTSFESQCTNLENMAAEGSGVWRDGAAVPFKVSRVKAEYTGNDDPAEFFDYLDTMFDEGYYDFVKENSDKLYDLYFYVMGDVDGTETLLIEDFEIVVAEKDGRYYTFG